MARKDWYLRVMVTLLVVGVWVVILRPVLAPRPIEAAQNKQRVANVVRAQRFEVLDAEGNVRAQLRTLPHGAVRLDLRDQDEKLRACLEVWSDRTPHLTLYHGREDGMSEGRASLSVSSTGSATMFLCGERGQGNVRLSLGAEGSPGLSLRHGNGEGYAGLTVWADGTSGLVLSDEEDRARTSLSTGGLEIWDGSRRRTTSLRASGHYSGLSVREGEYQHERVRLALDSESRPRLTLRDDSRLRWATIGCRGDGTPYIELRDTAEFLFEAPARKLP